jgi:hypothetical protein
MAEATRGGGLVEPAAAAELTDRRFLLRCYGMPYRKYKATFHTSVMLQGRDPFGALNPAAHVFMLTLCSDVTTVRDKFYHERYRYEILFARFV